MFRNEYYVEYTGSASNIVSMYKQGFNSISEYIENRNIIKPTESTFNRIKSQYGHLVTDNTYILISRNYKNKAPCYNTINEIPTLEETIKYLTINGINIINIGFPPQSYNIQSPLYIELNTPFTHEEVISLAMLTEGLMISAMSSGYSVYASSYVKLYPLTPEWSVIRDDIQCSLSNSRITSMLPTYDINLSTISNETALNILHSTKGKIPPSFVSEKPIHYIK